MSSLKLREMAVSGSFYPSYCAQLKDFFATWNKKQFNCNLHPRALIAPHAGYIYSGEVANDAYSCVKGKNYKRAVVIGPSHKIAYSGISGSFFEKYDTPCGRLDIDLKYLKALAKHFKIVFVPKVHSSEHSTEVQMPFLKQYLPSTKVVELIYGSISLQHLSQLIYTLAQDKKNLIIISSDLSHYYPLKQANELDSHCVTAISNMDPTPLRRCEACGKRGIEALLAVGMKLSLKSKIISYSTSADTSGDSSMVVGYMSAVLY